VPKDALADLIECVGRAPKLERPFAAAECLCLATPPFV